MPESTDDWYANQGSFWGTRDQLTRCARCGDRARGGYNEPRKWRDILKPSSHWICDECYDQLPEE